MTLNQLQFLKFECICYICFNCLGNCNCYYSSALLTVIDSQIITIPLVPNEKCSHLRKQIVLTEKPYCEWKGRPSPIGEACRPRTGGQVVPINNISGGPFDSGGNMPPISNGGGPPRGDDSGPPREAKIQDHTLQDQDGRGQGLPGIRGTFHGIFSNLLYNTKSSMKQEILTLPRLYGGNGSQCPCTSFS